MIDRAFRIALVFSLLWVLADSVSAKAPSSSPVAKPIIADLDPQVAARIDKAIQAKVDETGAVGVAIGVIRDRRIVYLQTFGYEDREAEVPVSRDTMFRWASCSKPVTAVAAMQLVEQGRLGLDDDVRKYVPEFPEQETPITVRQLLCHQGGIVHYKNGNVIVTKARYDVPHPFENVVTALDTFKESPLLAKPGTKYSYTTHGYILLSAVVERAGQQPFAEQVNERIAKPAALKTFRPDYQWLDIPHRATGYQRKKDEISRSTNTDVSWKLGGGGFISNIEDFAGFAAGLLQEKFVSPQTYKTMWTRQVTADGKQTSYGLGFGVTGEPDNLKGAHSLKVSHSGSQEKSRTRFVIYPERGTGAVMMTNSEWVNPDVFTTAIYQALKKPKKEPAAN